MTTKMPAQHCLACGNTVDAASNIEKKEPSGVVGLRAHRPKPGDVTLCIRCGCIMIWNKRMQFRYPTKAELKHLAADQRVTLALAAIETINKRGVT
jgi:hypothetical protein